MSEEIVNRVANSGIITLNLEKYHPVKQIKGFDLKDYLFKGLILREKDFREALKSLDWSLYQDALVHVYCSAEAIIPLWAYMLIATYLEGHASRVYFGTKTQLLSQYYREIIESMDFEDYHDKRVVIKGCSNKEVPASAYLEASYYLKRYARSIMFGEPCSTVPIFKKKPTKSRDHEMELSR